MTRAKVDGRPCEALYSMCACFQDVHQAGIRSAFSVDAPNGQTLSSCDSGPSFDHSLPRNISPKCRNWIWRRLRVFCRLSVKVCSWYKTHSNTGILAGVRYVFFLSVPGFQFGPVTVSFEAFSGHKTMMYTLKVGFIIVNLILQTVSRN